MQGVTVFSHKSRRYSQILSSRCTTQSLRAQAFMCIGMLLLLLLLLMMMMMMMMDDDDDDDDDDAS